MAGSQVSTSVTIISSLKGFEAISLTNPETSALTAIAAGSKVEVASAFFTFDSNETPNASSWTAVVTGRAAYIAMAPSGTAGSQILSTTWLDNGVQPPIWVDSKHGWYASAASSTRIVAGVMKMGATSAWHKFILPPPTIYRDGVSNGFSIINIMLEFENWDMESDAVFNVTHGLMNGESQIRSIHVDIDGEGALDRFSIAGDGTLDGGISRLSDSYLTMRRKASGAFHTSAYSAADGVVYLRYEIPDY